MKLNFRVLGEGEPLFVLHGVFGSSDNWQSVGKILAEKYQVFLIDQRNHGNSPHSEEFNYPIMSQDVLELIQDHGFNKVNLLGHSMGGKVAMEFATTYKDKAEKLIVVDIAPKYYAPHHQEVISAFRSVQLEVIKSRGEAEESMKPFVPEFGIRQFLLKNLKRSADGFSWKINLDSIEANIENVGVGLDTSRQFNGKSLFIGGGKSNYITGADEPLIKSHFPNSDFIIIPDAGHWVHAEKPQELIHEVIRFLQTK